MINLKLTLKGGEIANFYLNGNFHFYPRTAVSMRSDDDGTFSHFDDGVFNNGGIRVKESCEQIQKQVLLQQLNEIS